MCTFPSRLRRERGQNMPCILIQTICSRKTVSFRKFLEINLVCQRVKKGKQHFDNLPYTVKRVMVMITYISAITGNKNHDNKIYPFTHARNINTFKEH